MDLLLISEVPSNIPLCFEFVIEAAMQGGPAGDVIQSTSFFNFETSNWEIIDNRLAENTERSMTLLTAGDPARFIHPITFEVLTRIEWESQTFAGAPFFWSIDLDHSVWKFK